MYSRYLVLHNEGLQSFAFRFAVYRTWPRTSTPVGDSPQCFDSHNHKDRVCDICVCIRECKRGKRQNQMCDGAWKDVNAAIKFAVTHDHISWWSSCCSIQARIRRLEGRAECRMYRMPGRIQKAFQFGSGFLLSIDPHYIECPRWWRPCKRRVLSSPGNFENKLLLDFRWLLRSLLFVDFQQFHFGTLRSKCPGRWGALGNMVPEQKEFGVRSSYCSVEGMERCGYVLLESKAGILNFSSLMYRYKFLGVPGAEVSKL